MTTFRAAVESLTDPELDSEEDAWEWWDKAFEAAKATERKLGRGARERGQRLGFVVTSDADSNVLFVGFESVEDLAYDNPRIIKLAQAAGVLREPSSMMRYTPDYQQASFWMYRQTKARWAALIEERGLGEFLRVGAGWYGEGGGIGLTQNVMKALKQYHPAVVFEDFETMRQVFEQAVLIGYEGLGDVPPPPRVPERARLRSDVPKVGMPGRWR